MHDWLSVICTRPAPIFVIQEEEVRPTHSGSMSVTLMLHRYNTESTRLWFGAGQHFYGTAVNFTFWFLYTGTVHFICSSVNTLILCYTGDSTTKKLGSTFPRICPVWHLVDRNTVKNWDVAGAVCLPGGEWLVLRYWQIGSDFQAHSPKSYYIYASISPTMAWWMSL